ncbi:peptidase domain-containing ABC transporter [Microvirga subterranea]|uniref:Colicin V processing peptidase n=1 Tax=Microvirga subterranea TaxID=186651 RepID=A0A370H7W4_9HYPH|nr:peptidase domain-containing ABC transporter [Microvirga subterranea]RDI52599.1 colicin V processing peptidase [Microvirga subterranea]
MTITNRLNLGWGRRTPMILQTEASECGLASLAMIAGYFGYDADLADMRRRYGFSLKGATLKDVVRIADQIGFATRPLRLELEELPRLRLPCILHWDLNHFVVLVGTDRSGCVIHDPAFGLRHLKPAELSRRFTGVALELYPTDRFGPAAAPPRVRFRRLLGRMVGVKRALSHQLAMAVAIEVFAMASPLFMGWVVDHALVTADHDLLLTLVLGFLLLLVLQTSITAMRSWMLMGLSATLKVQSRANLFSHLISLPASFFEARHLGDVTSRFASQETILSAITTELVEAVMDGLMTGLTLAIMLVIAPDMAAIVVGTAVLYGILRWVSYSPLRQASMEAIVWRAKLDSHFLETLRGIRTIKLFNGQEDRRAHWLNLLIEVTNRQLTTQKLAFLFQTGNRLLLGLLRILIIWLAARQVLSNALSIGLMLAFIAYKDQFIGRVSVLIDRAVDLKMLRLHAERLSDIALTEPETRSSLMPLPGGHPPPAIELRNVSFRYSEHEPWVLDNISLRVDAEESVAIVGPSGGGKSTLLKLLAGLVQPDHGEILIDGEPLARIGLENHRARIGVVMQDDQLFAGSIADNISFFSERPDHERVVECAKRAAVHDDIMAMPMGYGTLIGDMGTVLSGGQKQRVVIARALYRQPSILLLDEATSHLDIEREKLVNNAFGKMRITRIVIAHRPETIRMSGRVIALDHGKILQHHAVGEKRPITIKGTSDHSFVDKSVATSGSSKKHASYDYGSVNAEDVYRRSRRGKGKKNSARQKKPRYNCPDVKSYPLEETELISSPEYREDSNIRLPKISPEISGQGGSNGGRSASGSEIENQEEQCQLEHEAQDNQKQQQATPTLTSIGRLDQLKLW